MIDDATRTEIARRAAIAADLFQWSEARIAGFAAGLEEASLLPTVAWVYAEDFGFDDETVYSARMETKRKPETLRRVGRFDAFRAVYSWSRPLAVPSEERMMGLATEWYDSGECGFEVSDMACAFDGEMALSRFLEIRTGEQWRSWFVEQHMAHMSEGSSGYLDLLLEKHSDPVIVVDNGEHEAPGVFDGWHRIGSQVLVGATSIRAVKVSPAPKPEFSAAAYTP